MNSAQQSGEVRKTSRRDFIRRSSLLFAGGAVGTGLDVARCAHAFGSDAISIGLIGCGTRGTSAAIEALNTLGGEVRLIAMADVFANRIQAALRPLKGRHAARVDVPRERQFVGLEAYQSLLQCPLDLVLLASPPGFRPLHFESAVQAGKHVFMERPVAVDATGVRRVLAANDEARRQGLAVAVGLQRRHEAAYQETIARVQEGAIGDVRLLRVYGNVAAPAAARLANAPDAWSYPLRNWQLFPWLSGGAVVEQHVQNLDVANWLMASHPVSAQGQAGRAGGPRTVPGPEFDYQFVEYTFADGCKLMSQCRQLPGCWNNVSEHAVGTEGHVDISGGKIYDRSRKLVWSTRAPRGGHQQEQHHLLEGLRRGQLVAEGEYGAWSTLTAILGRLAAQTGQRVAWDEALQQLEPPSPIEPWTTWGGEELTTNRTS